jgi:hypothetical protein
LEEEENNDNYIMPTHVKISMTNIMLTHVKISMTNIMPTHVKISIERGVKS